MKDEEILEKLIQIAESNDWKNDFSFNEWQIYFHDLTDKQPYIGDANGLYESCDSVDMEHVIFDKQFIQALCKAKYGDNQEIPLGNCMFLGEDGIAQFYKGKYWQMHIIGLSISNSRLEYLKEQFL